MKSVRKYAPAGWIAALYLFFLYPLLGSRTGFLFGDYGVQFHPWMRLYAESLRAGTLPLWTPLIQSGFPLFAEGQTGMLYLPNLLLFALLPFKAAYNGSSLLHFFLGAWFSFLFARNRKLSVDASVLTSLCFTFGSAYAGSFYNIVTMRSLVWFPLLLLLVEKFLATRRLRPLAGIAFFTGQSWLAGFPQTSAYLFSFTALYYFLRLREERPSRPFRLTLLFLGALGVSVLIGLPQLWATLSLASHSTRLLQTSREFVFWGSVPPWSLPVLFMYSWGAILNVRFYVGVAPLLVLLFVPAGKRGRVWWAVAGVSFLLAIGGFNPLCWPLLNLPVVSLLRNPSKFLFFTAFALSMLAGFSLDRLAGSEDARRALLGRAAKLSAAFLALALGAWAFLRTAEPLLLSGGRWWVRHFVAGKSHHVGDPAEYLSRVSSILRGAQGECSLANPIFWVPFIFAGAFLILLKKKRLTPSAVIFLTALDLLVFGTFNYGSGFIGNLRPYRDEAEARTSVLPRDGKWFDVLPESEAIFPPNRNITTGHAVIGAYSPLLDKDYFLLVSDLGVLDDSFGRRKPVLDELEERRPLLDFLGVKYLSLPGSVENNPGARGEFGSPGRLVYAPDVETALAHLKSRAFNPSLDAVIVGDFYSSSPVPAKVEVLESLPMRASVVTESAGPSVLTRNQVFDGGWKVRIDGKPAEIQRINLAFQGVEIPPGRHRVDFDYKPEAYYAGRWFMLAGLVLAALMAFLRPRGSREG